MSDPDITGVHHVTLTVSDVARSEEWYTRVLGFVRIARHDREQLHRVIMQHPASGVRIGLSRHHAKDATNQFDERRIGLDHLSFGVPTRASLERWADRLDASGVTHSGVKQASAAGYFLIAFRDPDDIQLELFYSPAADATHHKR